MRRIAHFFMLGTLGVVGLGATPAGAALESTPQTLAWARVQANMGVAVDLHDYYGLTLRFVSARTGASCAGIGGAASAGGMRRWRTFRCTTHLRGVEGDEFPGVAGVTLTLHVPATGGARPTVSGVHVTSCSGKACPLH